MILKANKLSKSFKSYKKEEGISGSIKSLFKRDYITKSAVDCFNLEIEKNQIIGLLGPNGAGKTTLMKMFTGIIVPSSGSLTINGHTPHLRSKEYRKKIALVMGQKSQLWWDIPAMDSFVLLKKYYELNDQEFNEKINLMSEMLNVKDLLHIHVRKLSLGERMKLELMASLLHSPDILFLDEPTIGLDLVAQEKIRTFIKDYYKKNNVTIIITSHYMADVEELCERLVLIMGGKKGYDGDLENFTQILGHEKSVNFTFSESIQSDSFLNELKTNWSNENRELEILVEESKLREISSQIISKYPVNSFYTEKLPIEKVMKRIMENPELIDEKS
jgi:ABC-2 type transport system ATP-binding protein